MVELQEENYELLKGQIYENLTQINKLEVGSDTRKSLINETAILIDKYNDMSRTSIDAEDKAERRKLEEKKEEDAKALEEVKMDVPKKRLWLEIGKIAAPVLTAVGSWILYDKAQKRALQFEETGSFTSSTGRESMHLPKILK